jgi:DNA-binding XRE family transcriptional regulator
MVIPLDQPFVTEAYDRLMAAQAAFKPEGDGALHVAIDGPGIRAARVALGLTQAKLAERLGIDGPKLSKMETGAEAVDPRTDLAVRALLAGAR